MSIFVKYVTYCIFVMYQIQNCASVIYHLNDSEYERMPPLFALDDYEPCLRQADGVYCLMELDLYGGTDKELISIIKGYSEHTVKHYNHTYIQRGVCVRKTCQKFIRNRPLNTIEALKSVLEECLNESIRNEYDLETRIKFLNYCDKNGDVLQKDASDWIVAGIIGSCLIVNLIGSVYDITRKKKKRTKVPGNQYLLIFSVFHNWQWLVRTKPSDPRIDRLKGLHAYRTIVIFLMIIAHVMWINSMGFTYNTHDFEKAYESIAYQLIFNGMMIVQIFFVQSGFFLAYMMLLRSEKQPVSWKMYPQLILMRWWRLTPPYAVMLAFSATWLRYLGSGPLWRLWVTDSVVADCRRYWWLHLLYINNYVSDDRFCAVQTWHVGAEMQVFLISLIPLLATTSRRRGLVLALLLVIGSLLPALHVWFQDLDGVVIMRPEFYRTKISDTFDVHIFGHNYILSHTIGISTACMLYHLQKNEIRKKKNKLANEQRSHPMILRFLSWCFFAAMICVFLIGRRFYADGPQADLVTRMGWAVGHRLILGGCVAFAIASFVMRFSEFHCMVFECPVWVVPSRLSYCVYLVHIIFIQVLLGTRAYLAQVSFYNMVIVHMGVALISYMAALPLYLFVEAPSIRLMKLLTST